MDIFAQLIAAFVLLILGMASGALIEVCHQYWCWMGLCTDLLKRMATLSRGPSDNRKRQSTGYRASASAPAAAAVAATALHARRRATQ